MKDALELTTTEIKCLDHGFVRLIDTMPRLIPDDTTGDFAIVQAARVSYGEGTKKINEDKGLITYLLKNYHMSPFEMVEFKFHMKLPIFVARQVIRHRTANLNEISARYSVMKDEFYIPDNIKKQSKNNKQGSSDEVITEHFSNEGYSASELIEKICRDSYDYYEGLIAAGAAREQARMLLPVNLYTEWYWKIDLRNFLNFAMLRSDSHAQEEVQVYSNAMCELIKPIVPYTWEAFEEHVKYAQKFSRTEIIALHNLIEGKESGLTEKKLLELRKKLGF